MKNDGWAAVGVGVGVGVNVGVGRVVFPDGSVLEKVGVTPDVQCIPTAKDMAEGIDPCLSLAIVAARKQLGLPELKEVKTADIKDIEVED